MNPLSVVTAIDWPKDPPEVSARVQIMPPAVFNFTRKGGNRNAFQFRIDFLNFGNLLNHDWGVGWRSVAAINNNNQVQLLTNPGVDAQGRINYRLAVSNNQLITKLWQTAAGTADVYQFQISLRYSFN